MSGRRPGTTVADRPVIVTVTVVAVRVTVTVVSVDRNRVRLAIAAPDDVRILRGELASSWDTELEVDLPADGPAAR